MPFLKREKDSRLYYQLIRGNPGMPYLVFLHEGLGCTAMWSDFPQILCAGTGCPGLVYDRLGYGKSSACKYRRTINYLHASALIELPLLLAIIGPETPYILIGHSDGGSIALIHASERPPLLRGVVTEAAHVFVDQETITGIEAAVTAWSRGKLEGLRKYQGEKTETLFRAWSETWLSSWFGSWNIEYLLPSIDVPLLVLQGKNDQYGSMEQVERIVAHASTHARKEMIDDCGHIPHLEAQSVVAAHMTDFIVHQAGL